MKLRLFVLMVLCAGAVLTPGSAESKTPTPPPPITLPPSAGDEEPPADAVVPSNQPGECSAWYRTGTFGGRWATDSTWWEYACRRTGMSDESTPDWTDYYSYDVSEGQSVYYGEWWTAPLMSWDDAGCSYWIDVASSQSYGPYACTAEWNDAPVAAFSVECSGLSCTVDGTSSSDSDGTIVEYLWYFGGGTDAVSGATAHHVFASGRTYTISLVVSDDVGDTGYTSQSVSVSAGTSPIATFTVACSGLGCSFDASASSDADGTIQTYTWSFGDTTWASGTPAQVTHTYGRTGTYSVTLTVTDDSGNSASAVDTVTVVNAVPMASFSVSCTGLKCSFDGRGSSDSDGSIAAYAWNFGDGTTATGASVSHTYTQNDTFTTTLTVTDDAGAAGSTAKSVGLISLSASAYRTKGVQKVGLSWTASSGGFDVYRNGVRIATVDALSFTDAVKTKGAVAYEVCAVTSSICSNEATVTF